MGDIKLFRLQDGQVSELAARTVAVEKSLQTLIEKHLESFLGVTFLATEYGTGRKHRGRIDTLGIDENNCPVIIEYKRSSNENIITQGLFYLDWLLDHKAEFKLLVMDNKGKGVCESIEWANSRLICIAGDFNRYDIYAVDQMNRNIELIRYKKFDDLVLLELVNATSGREAEETVDKIPKKQKYATVSEALEKADSKLKDLFESLKAFLLALGDDVQMKKLLYYFAFKKIRNIAAVELRLQTNSLVIYASINPDEVDLEEGFTRDVRKVGHLGTGGLEIRITSDEDFEKAKPLLLRSYELG